MVDEHPGTALIEKYVLSVDVFGRFQLLLI